MVRPRNRCSRFLPFFAVRANDERHDGRIDVRHEWRNDERDVGRTDERDDGRDDGRGDGREALQALCTDPGFGFLCLSSEIRACVLWVVCLPGCRKCG